MGKYAWIGWAVGTLLALVYVVSGLNREIFGEFFLIGAGLAGFVGAVGGMVIGGLFDD